MYRQLRELLETPEGTMAFMRWYFRVAPESAAAELRRFNEWLHQTRPAGVADQVFSCISRELLGA